MSPAQLRWVALRRLNGEEETSGIFDGLFDLHEEGDGFFAVDEAVVVAEGEIHHRAGDNLAVYYNGALLDFVHPEDAALGRVEDWGAQKRAVNAAVADRKDAAAEVVEGNFAVAGFGAKLNNTFFNLRQI